MSQQLLWITLVVLATLIASTVCYEEQTAATKQNALYQMILNDHEVPGSWPTTFQNLKLFTEDLSVTGNYVSDFFPEGRQKVIHSVGAIAKVKFNWNSKASQYTGLFRQADYGFVRASSGAAPGYSGIFHQTKKMVPGISIKFLRSGVPSGNFMAMWRLDGQEDFNFFLNPMCNHASNRDDLNLILKIGAKRFGTVSRFPSMVGLSDFAAYTQDGQQEANPNFPFALVFQPNPAISAKFDGTYDYDIPSLFPGSFVGDEVLYKVYAIPSPGANPEHIGFLQLTSGFHASAFADGGMFFKHTFVDQDFALKPEWLNIFNEESTKTDGADFYNSLLPSYFDNTNAVEFKQNAAAPARLPASKNDYHAIIIGSGLSGSNAAYNLINKHGIPKDRVLILEARDRVGGRTYSPHQDRHPTQGGQTRRDMGAEFISGKQRRLNEYIDQFGIDKQPIHRLGKKSVFEDYKGEIHTSRITLAVVGFDKIDLINGYIKFTMVLFKVSLPNVWESADAAAMDAMTLQQWADDTFHSQNAKDYFLTLMTMAYGSPAEEMSLLHIAYFFKSVGGLLEFSHSGDYHLPKGTQQVSEHLTAGLNVKLNHPVNQVNRYYAAKGATHDYVEVVTPYGKFTSDYVIVAAPAPFVRDSIAFNPPINAGRRTLMDGTYIGDYVKVHVVCEKPFWTENSFLFAGLSVPGPLVLFADGSFPAEKGDAGLLVGFIAGQNGDKWMETTTLQQREKAVKEQLHRLMYGDPAKPNKFLTCDYHEKQWALDPWAKGVTVCLKPGVLSKYGKYFAIPEDYIHYAGSETSGEWHGYMEGALASGERAAKEVAQKILGSNPAGAMFSVATEDEGNYTSNEDLEQILQDLYAERDAAIAEMNNQNQNQQ